MLPNLCEEFKPGSLLLLMTNCFQVCASCWSTTSTFTPRSSGAAWRGWSCTTRRQPRRQLRQPHIVTRTRSSWALGLGTSCRRLITNGMTLQFIHMQVFTIALFIFIDKSKGWKFKCGLILVDLTNPLIIPLRLKTTI